MMHTEPSPTLDFPRSLPVDQRAVRQLIAVLAKVDMPGQGQSRQQSLPSSPFEVKIRFKRTLTASGGRPLLGCAVAQRHRRRSSTVEGRLSTGDSHCRSYRIKRNRFLFLGSHNHRPSPFCKAITLVCSLPARRLLTNLPMKLTVSARAIEHSEDVDLRHRSFPPSWRSLSSAS